jgi:hypothetical protein
MNPEIKRQTADFLNLPAIETGINKRYNKVPKYPYWIGFIADPYHDQDTPPDSIAIAGGKQWTFPIVLEDDAHFHLMGIKYVVQGDYSGGLYTRFKLKSMFSKSGLGPPLDTLRAYNEDLDVSLDMTSPAGRPLYGAPATVTPVDATGQLRVTAIQTVKDGSGSLRTEYLIPAGGTFRITCRNNTAATTLKVNGVCFGYKIFI